MTWRWNSWHTNSLTTSTCLPCRLAPWMGLVALRQNLCNLSGAHLLDTTGEYNLPFVRHFFPDRVMQVVTLAYREQGLMTAIRQPKSNPFAGRPGSCGYDLYQSQPRFRDTPLV